jgi:hypothetical protein
MPGQIYYQTTTLPGGTAGQIQIAGGPSAGMTGTTLDALFAALPTSEPVATGVAWNNAGTIKLSSGIPPVVTDQPDDASADEGDTATFTVAATNATSYQWQRQEGGSGAFANISGATSSSYTTGVLSIAADNADVYRCYIVGPGGNVTSNSAILTVEDPDWGAFRVAAGITDATQKSAGNTLVVALKAGGFWTRMVALYPFLGGSASSHKYNLKDPRDLDAAKRLEFVDAGGSFTHSSNGALPAGGAYAKTFVDFNTDLPAYSLAWGVYNRTATAPSSDEMLIGQGTGFAGPHIDIYSTNRIDAATAQQNTAGSPLTTTVTGVSGALTGLIGFSLYGFNNARIYRGATALTTNVTTRWEYWSNSTPAANRQSYLWANNGNGTAGNKATRQFAFAFVGYGMTDAQWSAFNTIVTAFQTALGRNV